MIKPLISLNEKEIKRSFRRNMFLCRSTFKMPLKKIGREGTYFRSGRRTCDRLWLSRCQSAVYPIHIHSFAIYIAVQAIIRKVNSNTMYQKNFWLANIWMDPHLQILLLQISCQSQMENLFIEFWQLGMVGSQLTEALLPSLKYSQQPLIHPSCKQRPTTLLT